MRRRATVFVIDHDKVLFIHRFKNGNEYYVVPGGGLESGETPEQAAVREIKEETSLNIVIGKKIGELETMGGHEYFYIAQSWSGVLALSGPEAQRQSPDNIYQLEWVPLEKLSEIDLRKEVREILLRHLKPSS